MADSNLYGVVAEFDSPEALTRAVRQARRAGYQKMDAYSPQYVEELGDAMEIPWTPVPLITLVGGILGGLSGFGMCWYANVINYPLNIGGRPHNSWPAWIPITFELTVLFAALAAALSMLILNGLPRLHHPIFNAPHYEVCQRDRFLLCIEREDPAFSYEQTRALLESLNPLRVEDVPLTEGWR